MQRLGYGLSRAIRGIIGGFFISLAITLFSGSGLLDPSLAVVLRMAIMLSGILLFFKMQYWGTSYLSGWVLGVIVLLGTGLVSSFEIVLYVITPLIIIILRFL